MELTMAPVPSIPGTVPSREDLAAIAVGVGCELGVARGDYSVTLLTRGRLDKLYSIDRWSDHHDEREMWVATTRLAAFGSRSEIVRATFAEAGGRFPDGSFDFVYVDGYAHAGQESGATLRQWWPKVRSGGLFCGHDYDFARYPATVAAVDAFAAIVGVGIRLTGESELPSWIMVKP